MGGEWQAVKFGEFVTLQRGHDLPEDERRAGSIPVLGSFGITGWHDEARARGPGVTIGRSGASFGTVSFSPVDFWPLNTALYVTDFHGNVPRFAYYFLQTFDFASFNSGSAQPSLNRNFIHPVPIHIPPAQEQVQIAELLGALDDKIELNRCMAGMLEETARTIFKSWFVDFDPVRAKADGRPTRLPDEVAALFPCSLDDGAPTGWQAIADDVGESCRSVIDPSTVDPATPYVGLEHLPRNSLTFDQWGKAEDVGSGKIVFDEGNLLFGKLRPYFHKIAVAPFDGICSSDILVFRPKPGVPPSFLYLSFSRDCFVQAASAASSGTRMPRADWGYMSKLPAVLPPSDLLDAFDRVASPMIAAMLVRMKESSTLATLRDALLPKLISGELRIGDAAAVSAA